MRWMPAATSIAHRFLGSGRLPRVIVYPPSTRITSPVTCEARSERSQATAWAMSPAVASRRSRRVGHRELRVELARNRAVAPARCHDVRAHAARPSLECGHADQRLERHRAGACRAGAGKGLRPDRRRHRDPAARAARDRGGEPRLGGEERLGRPEVERSEPVGRSLLGQRFELDARRDGHEPVRIGVVAGELQAELRQAPARGDRPWWRDEEDAHQYFPTTRPPSTRRYAPVTILDATR